MKKSGVLFILALVASLYAQSESAYTDETTPVSGLIDPSRLEINHSISFGMGGSSVSNLKSQSMYSTMMKYQFNAPLTLSFKFGMPIHSTSFSEHNLTRDNLQSMDYFKNMPLSASLSWQPSENFFMSFSVNRQTEQYRYLSEFYPGSRPFDGIFYGEDVHEKRKQYYQAKENE